MIRYLSLAELEYLHRQVIANSGGTHGLRDRGGLEAAQAQPQMAFADQDLYLGLAEKAAALAYSLINNHPFIDGNKRIGHAAMEVFLVLNGCELQATVDDQERVIFALAAGTLGREEFTDWVRLHLVPSLA